MSESTVSLNAPQTRVLVVDDHPGTATTLARAISQIGPKIEVVAATSGKMALEQVKEGAVDFLITDMMMPGMNGLELIEKLQSHAGGRPTYTILITAYDVPGLKESARRLNVNETIIKPFRPERICQIVRRVVDEMRQAEPVGKPATPRLPFKILVADDVPDNVALLSRYLQNEGYAFVTAADGAESLERTRAEMPDLILLDVNMPEKDGFEVLSEIRADPALEHIPVIILTAARPDAADMLRGLNLGADDYVTKPFDRRELLARIRTKLRAKETEGSIRQRTNTFRVLPEIGKELSGRLDMNELTDILVQRAVETLGAMSGHVFIVKAVGAIHKEYQMPTAMVPPFHTELPKMDDLLNQLRENQQGILINNTNDNPLWRTASSMPSSSVMILPLFGRQDVIGFFVLFHEKKGYFNPEHQLLLQAIASQGAIAIQNVQLYESMSLERQRMAAILRSAADAILTFDREGGLVSLNPAGESLFAGGALKPGHALTPDGEAAGLTVLLNAARTSGRLQNGEISLRDERVFTALVTPIEEDGYVAILHDVTHFKHLERIKNEFISAVTHDLKNPISVITGFNELLQRVGPLNDKQVEYSQHIQAAAENMDGLVRCLMQLTKHEIGNVLKIEAVALSPLVSEIADEFQLQAHTKKQSLHYETPTQELTVRADPFQLKQALRNLVGNAIKYTPDEGCISLSLGIKQDAAVVSVKDTGCGIPPSQLPLIFKPFHRVGGQSLPGAEGDGLGLAIVKSIVERSGGHVSVESEYGKGSCFSISLPLVQEPCAPEIERHN